MIVFWIFAALMLAAALWLLIPALLGRKSIRDLDRNQQNVAIARDRLKELESEYGRGSLSEGDYEQAKQELEQALLNDVDNSAASNVSVSTSSARASLAWVALGVPLAAVLLYLQLGTPGALEPQVQAAAAPQGHAGGDNTASMEQLVAGLAAKLQQEPDNAEGWFMLGRSYMSMGRYPEAAEAFQRVLDQVGDEPTVMLRYADALAMAQGGQIAGKPFELIKKALVLKPDDSTGLWLAGLGYEEQGQYELAVQHWRKLEPMMQDDPASLNEVRNLIARAEQKLGRPVTAPMAETAAPEPVAVSGAALKVTVSLDAALQDKVSAGDTVFIFARAVEGPPMPLAAVRKQVRDLPVTVTLDDSMAMMPQMKLSNFTEVRIGARISKSGTPGAQSGDLQGEVTPVKTDNKTMTRVRINQVLP
ncbi:MAG: c-type cytochrome biogenesis protein CcmI [Halobacteria archaeon]|nr:c-type cytochrome biogenesis protein CcmI [Halobacteria archaeon]